MGTALMITTSMGQVYAQNIETSQRNDDTVVRNAIQTLEQDVGLHQKHMYEMDKNKALVEWVTKICSRYLPKDTEERLLSLWWRIEKRFENYSQAELLFFTESLYNKIQAAHEIILDLSDIQEVCQGKYMVYWIQMWLRTRHILLLQSSWLMNELDNTVDPNNANHYRIKQEYLDLMIKEHKDNKNRLWLSIPFFVEKNESVLGLTVEDMQLAETTQKLIESVMYGTLADMVKKRILRAKDLSILLPNMSFYRRRWCDQFHGAYNVILVYSSQWVKVDTRFNGLEIQVNICNNFFVLKDFYDYFSKIITHELWHHIYYFRDTNPQSFEMLCWDNELEKNARCNQADFVSDYAQTMASEDYAETFMVRYHQQLPKTTPILQQKLQHFETLFKNIY
jgi:hypothetical protein